LRLFSNKNRSVHLGPYPLERLRRTQQIPVFTPGPKTGLAIEDPANPQSLANAMRAYFDIMDRMRIGPKAPDQAPIPDDLRERSQHLKAACYYLDASMAGLCRVKPSMLLENPIVNESLEDAMEMEYGAGPSDNPLAHSSVREGREAWARKVQEGNRALEHGYALVIVFAYTREPNADEPGGKWLVGTQAQRAAIRAAEIGAVMANYLRFLGFEARLHTATASEIDFDCAVLAAGLGELTRKNGTAQVSNPYLGDGFELSVVSTTLPVEPDQALARPGFTDTWRAHGPGWWLGFGGARAGFQGRAYKNRPFHLGPYPMEKLKRVDQPTTLVDEANVPRVPKRHDMFTRAGFGDLGDKAKKHLDNFYFVSKSPFAHASVPVLGGMVPLQFGSEVADIAAGTEDPKQNAQAIKAALYYLGADMVGITEIPDYAWYSHDADGAEIKPYHKYAICILIDQGYETMEGASGDDWISGMQSMRAYMRAQLIGGIVGQHIRNLGYPAREHSAMDQDVLHIPLILKAGLGELSRIGELVLNPYVGPRFKSGVITTNMPLEPDKPIDFGLQDFCSKCNKCARECPVTAIPFGGKIMFNGYEIWKPDVEKCARYRITNTAGSACGRCMKTCPYNLEGVFAERPFLWAAMHLPFTRKWIAKLDDFVGNGRINRAKKWWWDLETDGNGRIVPARKTNERQLNFRPPLTAAEQKLGCYPADLAPSNDSPLPIPPDRKQAMQRYRNAEPPTAYRERMARGENAAPTS